MSGYYPCFAKEAADYKNSEGKWVCSYCGIADKWNEGWTYFGMLECTRCAGSHIEEVRCPKCANGGAV